MHVSLLLLFIPTCFALNMAPGPNNLLSISNAANHGFLTSCMAGIGRLLAFSIMIFLASAGLAAVIVTSEHLFIFIKVIGAAYLIYLASKIWGSNSLKDVEPERKMNEKTNIAYLMKREFLVAAANPKAILIFTAFLPQFVDKSEAVESQFMQLGGLFLILEWVAIAIYSYLGLNLQRWLKSDTSKKIFNRLCSSVLGIAGLFLLFSGNT